MSEFKIKYDKARYPMQQRRSDNSWGCRGCGGPIPKGRQSWCSNACVHRFNPQSVLHAVRQRDKEVCCECGHDAQKARLEWLALKNKMAWAEWIKLEPVITEYDHIIPFSEGGLTVLENIRTLCSRCHMKRTIKWRFEKRQRRLNNPLKQLNLL